MDQFFTQRLDGYEEHMSRWKDHYHWMAQVVPEGSHTLLDIGCGTGLELDETLHHFKAEKKAVIFRKIFESLREGGCYIECDYIAQTQEEEDLLFRECALRRERDQIPEDVFVHFDTPLTLAHEIEIMKQTGFKKLKY